MSLILLADISNNKSSGTNVYLQEIVSILKSKGITFKLVAECELKSLDLVRNIHDDYLVINKRPALFDSLVSGVFWDLYIYFLLSKYDSKIIISTGSLSKYWGILALSKKSKAIFHTYPKKSISNIHFVFKFLKRFYKNNQIYTVSNFSKTQIETMYSLSNIGVIYNYSKLEGKGKVNRVNKFLPYNILTVGNFTSYKNVEIWFKVAKELVENGVNVKFTWCGGGDLLDYYNRLVVNNNLQSKIILMGHVDKIEEEYAIADIYFQPSLIENHSLSVLDALSYGLPCVLSDVGGMRETASEKSAFFVQPFDVDLFSSHLKALVDDLSLYSAMSDYAYLEYKENFHKNNFCKRLVDEKFI